MKKAAVVILIICICLFLYPTVKRYVFGFEPPAPCDPATTDCTVVVAKLGNRNLDNGTQIRYFPIRESADLRHVEGGMNFEVRPVKAGTVINIVPNDDDKLTYQVDSNGVMTRAGVKIPRLDFSVRHIWVSGDPKDSKEQYEFRLIPIRLSWGN